MNEELTLSVASVNMVLYVASHKGADRTTLCQKVGIDPAILTNPDGRVTIKQIQELWKEAIQATGDENLALHLGEAINPASVGIVAYVMMNCPTVGKSLEKLCVYQDIICEGMRTTVEVAGQKVLIQLQIISPSITAPRNAVDSELSVYLYALKSLVGHELPMAEVWFAYPEPLDISEHKRIFGPAKLFFNKSTSALVFDKAYLDLPVINANPDLLQLFDKYAYACLDKFKKEEYVKDKVKKEIIQLLKGEEPSIELIARSMAMSIRSLQAKLKEEGCTYQQLLDQVRKELAIEHLQDNYLSTTDIAYLLGFSEPSVFFRSFKKWTGTTPGAYRLVKA